MSGSSNRPAWPSNDDFTFFALIIIVLGTAFFGWLAWINYHPEISSAAAWLIHAQIVLIRPFTSALNTFDDRMHYADMSSVTVWQILSALGRTGSYLRVPAVVLIMLLSLACFTMAPAARFCRHLDLDGLIREHARTYAPLQAFVKRKLKLAPFDLKHLRPCDPCLDVGEWVALYATAKDGSLDEAAAAAAFVSQLGPVWRGLAHASPLVRFLCAAFALHLDQKRKEAQDLLGEFAHALPDTDRSKDVGPDAPYPMPATMAGRVDDLFRSAEFVRRAEAVMAGHAYTTPAVMSLLNEARKRSGVLAPGQFVGLKMVDRSLWYALHSLGFEGAGPGQTTHPNPRIEAAGARDHWASERLARRSLIVPSVNLAVDAVRAALLQNAAKATRMDLT